jgi:hypothetical protein
MADELYEIELLDPVEHPAPVPGQRAKRLRTLEGATIGLLENSKFNSSRLLDYIAEILVKDYGAKAVVRRGKRSASFPAPPEVYDELATRTDAVVTGVGD